MPPHAMALSRPSSQRMSSDPLFGRMAGANAIATDAGPDELNAADRFEFVMDRIADLANLVREDFECHRSANLSRRMSVMSENEPCCGDIGGEEDLSEDERSELITTRLNSAISRVRALSVVMGSSSPRSAGDVPPCTDSDDMIQRISALEISMCACTDNVASLRKEMYDSVEARVQSFLDERKAEQPEARGKDMQRMEGGMQKSRPSLAREGVSRAPASSTQKKVSDSTRKATDSKPRERQTETKTEPNVERKTASKTQLIDDIRAALRAELLSELQASMQSMCRDCDVLRLQMEEETQARVEDCNELRTRLKALQDDAPEESLVSTERVLPRMTSDVTEQEDREALPGTTPATVGASMERQLQQVIDRCGALSTRLRESCRPIGNKTIENSLLQLAFDVEKVATVMVATSQSETLCMLQRAVVQMQRMLEDPPASKQFIPFARYVAAPQLTTKTQHTSSMPALPCSPLSEFSSLGRPIPVMSPTPPSPGMLPHSLMRSVPRIRCLSLSERSLPASCSPPRPTPSPTPFVLTTARRPTARDARMATSPPRAATTPVAFNLTLPPSQFLPASQTIPQGVPQVSIARPTGRLSILEARLEVLERGRTIVPGAAERSSS
mmetsp:Transcript_42578/g.117479  ORF Transcript_42578/g.117479 Transcript_42578/m.117479 type:complete len:617 (+) Transcript_42578:73-1923(+)